MSRLDYDNPLYGITYETELEKWARENGVTLPGTGGSTGGGGTKPAPAPTQTYLQQRTAETTGQPGIKTLAELQATPGAHYINSGKIGLSDGSTYNLKGDGTGLWGQGYSMTKAEQGQYRAGAPVGAPAAAQGTQTTMPPGQSVVSPGQPQPAVFGSLQPFNGVNIPGWDAYSRPIDMGISDVGRQQLVDRNGLNQIMAGRQGSATQFPVAPGMRSEGQVGNSINFAGTGSVGGNGQLARTLEPANLFGPAVANVPGTYVQGQGNINDSNRMFELPFNITPTGANMAQIAGNNVQVQGAPGSGVGYGFALNAMPASSVGAYTGRDLSNDPALQAVQTLMLNSAIARGDNIMGVHPQQFGGNPAGSSPYYGGGAQPQGNIFGGYSPVAATPSPAPYTPPASFMDEANAAGRAGAGVGSSAIQGINNMLNLPAASAPRAPGMAAGSLIGSMFNPSPAAPAGVPQGNPAQAGYQDWVAQQQRDAAAGAGHPNYNMTANILGGAPTSPMAAPSGPALMAALAGMSDEERQAAMAAGLGAGYGEDGGTRFAARGGSFDFRPLGTPATKSLVTSGPMGLVDLSTGQVKVVVGEDNADRDRLPDRERVTLTPSSMHVTPLDPPRMMAGGGFQPMQQQQAPQTGPNWKGLYASLADYWQMTHPLYGPLMMAEGGTVPIDPGGIPVDSRNGLVPRVSSRPDSPNGSTWSRLNTAESAAPPAFEPNPGTPVGWTPPGPDPALDPAILAPWQQAHQGLAQQQHLRDVVDEPRRRAAGFVANSAMGIPVQQGEIPTGPVGPGMFYDLRPQVDRNINQILGAQADIRAYGPIQDTTPMYGQLSDIGIKLDAQERLRSLDLQKAGLEATNEIEKQQALLDYNQSANTLAAAQNALNDATNAYQVNASPENLQHLYDTQAKLTNIQQAQQQALIRSTSDSPALVALRAQQAALQAQLGQDFNEATAQTQKALLQKQISDQQSRAQKVVQVGNLAQIGVPKLNASILPVRAA